MLELLHSRTTAPQSGSDFVHDLNMFLDEIARTTAAQATAVTQVVEAIADLDVDTQHNATLVEETSASAKSLSDQATKLTHDIARFQVS